VQKERSVTPSNALYSPETPPLSQALSFLFVCDVGVGPTHCRYTIYSVLENQSIDSRLDVAANRYEMTALFEESLHHRGEVGPAQASRRPTALLQLLVPPSLVPPQRQCTVSSD
jgi:hypothetical protein